MPSAPGKALQEREKLLGFARGDGEVRFGLSAVEDRFTTGDDTGEDIEDLWRCSGMLPFPGIEGDGDRVKKFSSRDTGTRHPFERAGEGEVRGKIVTVLTKVGDPASRAEPENGAERDRSQRLNDPEERSGAGRRAGGEPSGSTCADVKDVLENRIRFLRGR